MFHLEAAGGESRDLLTVHVEFAPRQDEHHSYAQDDPTGFT